MTRKAMQPELDHLRVVMNAAVEASGVSRADIARRMGDSRSGIIDILRGNRRNLTWQTIANVADAIGMRPVLTFVPKDPE